MSKFPIRSSLGLAIIVVLASTGLMLRPAAATQQQLTFMQCFEEWKYPGILPRFSGQMRDGGNPEISDVTCKGLTTTADSFEDVVKFYAAKIGDEPGDGKQAHAVMIQEDSEDRPVKVRMFSVYRADVSNTIVVTRGENEKLTHIAWSQYRRLSKP